HLPRRTSVLPLVRGGQGGALPPPADRAGEHRRAARGTGRSRAESRRFTRHRKSPVSRAFSVAGLQAGKYAYGAGWLSGGCPKKGPVENEFADFLHYCRVERRLAELTCKAYERDVKACLRFL